MTTTIEVSLILIVALAVIAVLSFHFIRKLGQARQALAQSQDRLGVILRSSQMAVWTWEIAPNIVTADDNTSALFGLPLGQFPHTVEGFAALIHPDDRARVMQETDVSVQQGADYNTEFRIVWPDGTIRYLSVRAKIYDGGGRPKRLTGLCWNVTDRRMAEENLRTSNDKLTRSLEELERRKKENSVLSEMADLLQACSSSSEAYEIVARFCAHLFPNCAGALFIFSASRNLVHNVVSWGDPVIGEASFEMHNCWALRRGHSHIDQAGQFANTRCPHLKEVTRDGQACLPLIAHGTGMGIVYLQNRQGSNTQSPQEFLPGEDRELAAKMTERVALSLANLSLQEALRVQSIRDPLTGLYNRRYLEESGERELHRMERREQSGGLLMMDLDHFKTFNDTFGHDAGDAVLRAFGQFLRDNLRKEDIGCRYGGEEFCVLLSESSPEDTIKRAEQLRSEIKHLNLQHRGRHLGAITISIGVACYPTDGAAIGDLLSAADSALYLAKTGGRDRVITGAMPAAESVALSERG